MPLDPLVAPAAELTRDEVTRYSRHLLIPGVEQLGQRRLKNARVLVVGAGGLGSPVLQYLAAAGIGTLGIVDDDVVDVTNLHRQVIHSDAEIGRLKVDSARASIARLNPHVTVETVGERLTADNALEILTGYDVVVDGTDNFPTRYLVNDACALLGLPLVWGSILRFDGQVTVFWADPPAGSGYEGVQYRDVFPEPPAPGTVPSCAEAGVLGVLCGAVGSAMATEVVKLVTGIGEPLLGRLLVVDALAARWREIPVRPDPHRVPRTSLADEPEVCAVPPSSSATTSAAASSPASGPAPAIVDAGLVSPRDLAARLAARALGDDDLDLMDVREPAEHNLVAIAGARLVPLAGILDGSALGGFDRDRPVVVHCKSGVRSAQARDRLVAAGFVDVSDLRGGILAWIDEVEPHLPRY